MRFELKKYIEEEPGRMLGVARLERLLNAGREGLCAINAQAANERAVGVTTKVLKSFEYPASEGRLSRRWESGVD